MKKLIVAGLCALSTTLGFAQSQTSQEDSSLTKKGKIFLFWGWNTAAYSDSDIHFKGNGYDFTLKSVSAHDRITPFTFKDYFAPDSWTIPQTNARIGYFVKDNVAVVLGLDHMKYVMDQNQTVGFEGHISDPTYASMVQSGSAVNLTNEQFLTFEHTDGLNYINVGVEKYQNILNKKGFDVEFAYGAGVGALFPKSNVKLFGNERSDRFHLAGFGADARASFNAIFANHIMLRLEGKIGYINMPDIKTTLNNKPDKASQDFMFAQANLGIGYIFGFKKKN
ncbi:hypothetical protein [Soonwooa sp.]|uniref:hypothetical protein n=1 Tax=Soonwooa sp. TaxID=1938592 RepID=UPI0028ABEF69|nr:hypothetical protein [Soonwooa sp.]